MYATALSSHAWRKSAGGPIDKACGTQDHAPPMAPNTPSSGPLAIDLLQTQLPCATIFADKAMKTGIEYHTPAKEKRSPSVVARSLQHLRNELAMGYRMALYIFLGKIKFSCAPTIQDMNGDTNYERQALNLLRGAFANEINTNLAAATVAVQIAVEYAQFRAQMDAILREVRGVRAHREARPVRPVPKAHGTPPPRRRVPDDPPSTPPIGRLEDLESQMNPSPGSGSPPRKR